MSALAIGMDIFSAIPCDPDSISATRSLGGLLNVAHHLVRTQN